MAKKSKELENIIEIFEYEERIDEEELEKIEIDVKFIYQIQENALFITDERDTDYVLHSVESIILTLIFAIIANCNTFVQIHLFMCKHFDWLQKHIIFDNGIPSISTIKRVVSFINPNELEKLCNEAMNLFIKNNDPLYKDNDLLIDDIKSMDGKSANASGRTSSINGPVDKMNAMSVVSIKNDCCEATEFIKDKSNEIPTGPELLKKLNIENCIVTFDAMSTQENTINYIVDKHAFYVAPVKGNQPTLEENIKEYFNDKKLFEKAKNENYYLVTEKIHGQIEQREYIFTNDVDWLYNKDKWKCLKSIGMAIRTYKDKNDETKQDIRYFISNIEAGKIQLIAKAIRGEWSIENKLHFFLDTVFLEDKNTCFVQNTQKNLNILRKFCLTILKKFKTTTKLSMNSIRFDISMDFEGEIEKIIGTLYK